MSDLVEHILSENYVSASDLFESRLNEILEKKLVEMKKCIQAEGVGGETNIQTQAKKQSGYRPAHQVFGLSDYDKGREKVKQRQSRINRAAAHLSRKGRPEVDKTAPLDTVPHDVVKDFVNRDSLKAKKDRILAKAQELDKRGSGAVNRASRVKGAYYSMKASRAGAEKIGHYIGSTAKSILQGLGEENA
jgi:hypothetical protein